MSWFFIRISYLIVLGNVWRSICCYSSQGFSLRKWEKSPWQLSHFKDRRDREKNEEMFSLQAFLPLFSHWSPLVIFPRQFFASALPSERLEPGYQVLRKVPSFATAPTGGGELAWLLPERLRRRLGVSERRQCSQPLQNSNWVD